MKKIYQAPNTIEVKVKLSTHLMENSIVLSSTTATVNGSGEYETLSRRSSIWEDEDEDYYE